MSFTTEMSEEDCPTVYSTTSECLTPFPENPEDQLVGVADRTFAQLLLEQLGKLEDKDISPEETKRQSAEPKPFLRRGTGLTRFNLPPDPAQQPSQMKRSQSQPRVSQVKSRLSQETQSFANKKTVAKRSVSISPAMRKRKPESPAKSPKKTANTMNLNTMSESQKNIPGVVDLETILQNKLKVQQDNGCQKTKEFVLTELHVNGTSGETTKVKMPGLKNEISENESDVAIAKQKGLAKVGDKRGKHQERKKKEQELECCKEKLDDKRMKNLMLNDNVNGTKDKCKEREDNDKPSTNSPSYLIWSIFTKQRELEKARVIKKKNHTSAELEQEIESFKNETARVQKIKRKLDADKDKLSIQIKEFKKQRDADMRKIEEEKKRIKRDKLILEKANRQSKDIPECNECAENKSKAEKLLENLNEKEIKWAQQLNKLNEELNKVEKEKMELENENNELRNLAENSDDDAPDSGFRTQHGSSNSSEHMESDDDLLDAELRKSICSSIYATLCQGESKQNTPMMLRRQMAPAGNPLGQTPALSFSPVESLESRMSLVSGVVENPAELKETREKRYRDGRLEVWYSNGNRKEVSGDGRCVKIFYYNGDIKETNKDEGMVKYLYSHTQTWHNTYQDGREVLVFKNGQEEIRFPDGSISISFPDGSTKTISSEGVEVIKFSDGTVVTIHPNGDKVVNLLNGQVEEHTSLYRKRSHPDGTVKILHRDGRVETRYKGGRVKIKDARGVVIEDNLSTAEGK